MISTWSAGLIINNRMTPRNQHISMLLFLILYGFWSLWIHRWESLQNDISSNCKCDTQRPARFAKRARRYDREPKNISQLWQLSCHLQAQCQPQKCFNIGVGDVKHGLLLFSVSLTLRSLRSSACLAFMANISEADVSVYVRALAVMSLQIILNHLANLKCWRSRSHLMEPLSSQALTSTFNPAFLMD